MAEEFYEDTPSIQYVENDAFEDAKVLRKAMKGFGTDEAALISILCRRTLEQRLEIASAFKSSFGKDLIKDIKSEVSGQFEDVLVGLLTPRYEYLAKALHDAVDGIGTKDSVLVDVICSSTNEDIEQIKAAYQDRYNSSLEDDVMSDTSGAFRRILVSLINGGRNESDDVDIDAAIADAHELFNAGEGQWGTDESAFNAILATRSILHLRQVFIEYEKISGHSMKDGVKKEFSGDIEDAMVAVVTCVNSPAAYFANRLHKAMDGIGTKDESLIFIVVSRADVDMHNIKEEYQFIHCKPLGERIKSETSGDYQKALLTLIGHW